MKLSALLVPFPALAAAQTVSTSFAINKTTTPSLYDRHCTYPIAASSFSLPSYLGRWYQVAGTLAPFTANCRCISADYGLNANGTVSVSNRCTLNNSNRTIAIAGTAAAADPIYGAVGVFRVSFPGQPPPACAGPNYIVQAQEAGWAVVPASNFSTLFVLSRGRRRREADVRAWLGRAEMLGSDLRDVVLNEQTGCGDA